MKMPRAARLTLLYIGFAALSTAANLGSQALVVALYHGAQAVPLSILVGTLVGMPIRYVLEKRHIFEFSTDNLAHDGRLFVLYSAMGVITTLLFWAIEWSFHRAFGTDSMRYIGGLIGLSLGYAVKYLLDRHFVFVARPALAAECG